MPLNLEKFSTELSFELRAGGRAKAAIRRSRRSGESALDRGCGSFMHKIQKQIF